MPPNELDLNLSQQNTLPPELFAQQQALNRQQQMASLLMQQNQQPQGQMISGRYVAPSFFQNLAPVANMLTGAYLAKKGDEQAAKLAEQLRTGREEERKAIIPLIKQGKIDEALALPNVYGGTTPFQSALISNFVPKKTDKLIEYEQYKMETPEDKRLGFTDWADRNEKARLALDEKRYGLEAARFNLEKSKAEVNPAEAPLRTSFLGQIQPHIQISQAYRKIESAPETAAGDMSRIFGYMKILDPGSTVREGEYASAENARGVPDSVRAQYNRVMSGQRLTPKQRDEFTQAAGDLVNSQKTQFGEMSKYYTDISARNRINPENVIYDPYKDLNIKTTPPKAPKQPVNANQQLNIPGANTQGGWNIINVTPSK